MNSINDIIAATIENINKQLSDSTQLINDDNQLIVGKGSPLDSLTILLFITELENKLLEEGRPVSLLNYLVDTSNNNIFNNIKTIRDFLEISK